MMGIVQLSDTAANLLYSDRDSSWNIIRTIVFNDKQLRRSKYRGFTNTTDSSSAEIIFETVRFLEIPIWRCFYKGISLQNIVFLCCFVFLKFLVFILTTDTTFSTWLQRLWKGKQTLSQEARQSVRARGRGFPPGTMSMSPGYFHTKNKRKIKPKELPRCTIPLLLIAYTRQFEILATVLRRWVKFGSPEDNTQVSISCKDHSQK